MKTVYKIFLFLVAVISLLIFIIIEFPLSPIIAIFILFKKEPFDIAGNLKIPMLFFGVYGLLMAKALDI